jgi:hypothetical protein
METRERHRHIVVIGMSIRENDNGDGLLVEGMYL